MRILLYSVLAILLGVAIAGSAPRQGLYVIPLHNDIAVFTHSSRTTGEGPAFVAGTGDWLMVIDAVAGMYEVTDLKGNIGWVDKSLVKQTATGEALTFNDASVLAYLDNPTPVYILDASNPYENSILMERSFSRELSANVDMETVQRIVGKTVTER